MNKSPTIQSDPAILAVLHRTGETWRAMVVNTHGVRPAIVATREFPADQHARIDSWFDEQHVSQVLCVLPASCVICRNCSLPDAQAEQLELALRLQAEAHLLGMAPPHRLAMAVLPTAAGETSRNGLILAWPETSEFTAPVNGARPVNYVPDVAAIAALLNGSRPAEPLLWLDRSDGSVALAMSHAAGALFRGTHEDPRDSSQWPGAIGRLVAETGLSVGHSGPFIESTVRSARSHAAQVGPMRSALFLPSETISSAASSAQGASTDKAWWSNWGVALGALLARTGPLSALTRLQSAPPAEEPSIVKSAVAELSRPRTAVRLAVICVLLLALGPLVVSALRLAVLNIRFGDVSAELKASEIYKAQLAMYRELERQQSWPMTKLLADIVSNTPEGIELDIIRVEGGSTFTVSGLTRAHGGKSATEVVALMQEQLRSTGMFSDIVLNWGEGNNMGVYKFDVSAKVTQPYRRTPYEIERDYALWTLAMRQAGEKAPTAGATAGADSIEPVRGPVIEAVKPPEAQPDPDALVSDTDEADDGEEIGGQGGRFKGTGGGDSPYGGAGKAGEQADATLPPHMDIPEPLTPEQIKAMTKEDAKAAVFKIATAEKHVRDDAVRERLKNERRLLIERLKQKE